MWLKLCLLLMYITVLFVLARLVEALTWYETGSLSRRLLDPMTLSVAKLKALLEQRGVSYDTVVEKGDLTQLVERSGTVHKDEVDLIEMIQSSDDSEVPAETNFTSGAHFYEQVEDAKDSVWLVQVLAKRHNRNGFHRFPFSESSWKSIRKKVSKFGINTGSLDCAFDPWWCEGRGWHTSHLLLALPQLYKQKANVATHTYQGPLRQDSLASWMRQKLQEKIETVREFRKFKDEWLTFENGWRESEVRALLFTDQDTVPMFFSALSVKFPGRVKFGVINQKSDSAKQWAETLLPGSNWSMPLYLIITSEKAYVYGKNPGDSFTFSSMETLLKFLHPCLNDIFILSFLVANLVSTLELVIAQGSLGRRLRRFLWCVVKFNAAVIMLWLPLIAVFQLPYLDHVPSFGLKLSRVLATSSLGEALRRDILFFSHHSFLLVASFLLASTSFGLIAYWVTGGRYEEDDEPWFNFSQMRTLTHLRSNEFFEPWSIAGYDVSRGFTLFGSRLYLPSMTSQPIVSSEYIHLLPTWPYHSMLKTSYQCCHMCSSEGSVGKEVEIVGSLDDRNDSGESTEEPSHLSGPGEIGHWVSCTASADDLLDGNYDCDCQQHEAPIRSSTLPFSSERQATAQNPPVVDAIASQNQGTSSTSDNILKCTKCNGGIDKEEVCTCSAADTTTGAKEKSSDGHVCTCGHSSESPPSLATTVEFPEGYLACSQCVICLDEYRAGADICGLPCGHVFHHSCILTWLKCEHHFCPVCRWPSFRPKAPMDHAHVE